jgi:hypothetical protein
VAPDGQFPVANPEQIKAQYLSPAEVYKTHFGEAVVAAGTSVGHDPVVAHFGKQTEPVNP